MYMYVCVCKHIYGDTMTSMIPQSMHGSEGACYPLGVCYSHGNAGSSSSLFYIDTTDTRAMIWPVDYQAKASS